MRVSWTPCIEIPTSMLPFRSQTVCLLETVLHCFHTPMDMGHQCHLFNMTTQVCTIDAAIFEYVCSKHINGIRIADFSMNAFSDAFSG